uniref:Glycine cleavage system H protein n=1 Tax=Neobodo designis TaxID=312471 RepID=A0A7S1Q8Z6_NEODS|mmetsp:Transcript_34739/g.107281  ORF Transcript_34739/g.107281 Transcript_34739/m.107281 type:complete len:146 (+) Transcript_34739:52-489(+)
MRRAFARCFAAPLATAAAARYATTYYTKEHEWLSVEDGSKVSTIGITKVAVNELGAIMFVGLPVVGDEVTIGADLADVESVKTATKVYSPVNGKVVEVNSALESDLAKICDEPETEGWIAKVEFDELPKDDLMDAAAYKAFCEPQ